MVQALRTSWERVGRQRVFPPPCARSDCHASAASRIWRRTRAIRLNDAWLCSPQCLEKETRVLFHQISSTLLPDAVPKHRVPLGLLMLEHGYVTEEQLRNALGLQARERKGKIGEWLQALGFVTERQLLTVLGVQWACPLLSLRDEPDTICSSTLPVPLLRALHLFPVRFIWATRLLYVAVSLELNYRALAAIDQIANCRTIPCLVEDGKMHEWLRRAQNQHDVQLFDRSSGPAEMARITGSYVVRLSSEEVRVVRCGPYVWARLIAGTSKTDLLFTTKFIPERQNLSTSSNG